ncbi:MAG: hypothetical protein NDI61_05045 [Bdellovibrionaceae bacterium]|nr:hypothetical protein [Pseudobdellovibrionaceae bacterium]
MKRISVICIFIFCGCATHKFIPTQLDRDFSKRGELTASQTKLMIAPELESELSIRDSMRTLFSDSGKNTLAIRGFKKKYRFAGKGFQCFEPYLLVISLGIIPIVCSQEYSLETDWISENGAPERTQTTIEKKSVAGWAALIVTLFPDWSFGRTSAEEAFISTVVNKKAE